MDRFICNMFGVGLGYSFALYFTALLDEFNKSPSTTSWVGSTCIGTLCGMGMVTGKLIAKFGVRKVMIAGGIIASSGLLISSFMPSLYPMYFTYGVLIGFNTRMHLCVVVCDAYWQGSAYR